MIHQVGFQPSRYIFQLHSPLPKRQVHFTCGPSRTEAEHPQPRFGQVGFANSTAILMAFALLTFFDCVKRDSPFATTPNEGFAHLVFRIEKVLLNNSFTRANLWSQVTLRRKRRTIATTRRQEYDDAGKCHLIMNPFHENGTTSGIQMLRLTAKSHCKVHFTCGPSRTEAEHHQP